MSDNNLQSISKLTLYLRIVVLTAAVMTVAEDIFAFFSHEPVALYVQGELWTKEISSFSVVDRLVIFSVLGSATLLWVIVLYQFWHLCRLYQRNMIFMVANARCFINIGWALIGMGIINTLAVPVIGAFLTFRDIIPQMPDMDTIFIVELDLLVAGLFFLLIAKIMEQAAVMQEEANLTV